MQTVSQNLLRWYRKHGRNLPWRQTCDPYRILISEIMLQQTQVDRVLLFYDKWMRAFPTFEKLARAKTPALLHAWAGLGYNRRPLMLREIARQIVARGVPDSLQAWRALKGIGPYTAAAIRTFSAHERLMPLDTNIRRVLARLFLGIPFPSQNVDTRLQKYFDQVLPKREAFYDVPQALFDLASLVCTKQPACARCPLRTQCKAAAKFLSGRVGKPQRLTPRAHEHIHPGKRFPDRIYRGRILRVIREHSKGIVHQNIGPLVDATYGAADHLWITSLINKLIQEKFICKRCEKLYLSPH
ncbi:A/G-specific adenine glycosylase [Candidatus Uhrbacteria bacterium]|nr:A/G-specific adenine glycosylase [Candidatus Uhrbacteria bacterium]